MHFHTILIERIRNHIQGDIFANRFKLADGVSVGQLANNVYPNVLQQLEAQGGRCFYSGIGLTHNKSWRQLSIERLNNKLPHFTHDGKVTNCVIICRLFNAARQLSRPFQYLIT